MKLRTIASASLLLLAAAPAAAATITFEEGLTGMFNSPGSFVPASSRLSDFYLASLGVSFSSGAGYVAVVDHIAGCGSACTPTPPLIIGGTSAGNILNYGIPITATFFLPSDTSIMAVTDSVSVASDLVPIAGTITLEAYDASGALLATDTKADGSVLSINAAGIHSVRFYSQSATVGFDNFTFGTLTGVVPEPGTWALMIAGFGMTGAALRRRRRGAPLPA